MRAVAALLTIPGADKHPQLNEFVTQVLQSTFALPIKAFTATYDVIRSRAPPTWRACSRASRRTPETLPPMGWTSAEGVAAVVQGAVCLFYFHIYVQSYDNDIFVLLFFRWGQWECVWDGGCEKKAGWFGTFDGGGPHPSPWTSAPFKKVMAQDFVILLLKHLAGVMIPWLSCNSTCCGFPCNFILVCGPKRFISDLRMIGTTLVTLQKM